MSIFDVFGFFFVVGLYVALIVLGFYSYRAVKRKRVKQSCVLIAALLFHLWFMGVVVRVLPGSNIYYERSQMQAITGHAFRMQEIGRSEHSDRAFNGDGLSFEVFSIPDSVAKELRKPSNTFFEEYPKRDRYRDHWEVEHWKETIPPKDEDQYIRFARLACQSSRSQAMFQSLLAEKGNYYSYLYYMHGSGADANVGNIDFFIISPSRKILVIMNVNT
ncbi:hypothetical protein NT6N_02070 [Oceaniferula spumae]|uniref:Uncharacterized protein n=1 Tax=Oceaniferula spumae TaxID=2979115 RepID=A0AAT9FGT4_9BACT